MGAPGGARLLAVVVEETDALLGETVDVGRLIAHQTVRIAAQVRDAYIVPQMTRIFGLP
jgi:hypothetical protein